MASSPKSSELRQTLVLALPMMAGQFSQMLVGLADTIMIGRLGPIPLAASAFANGIWHVFFLTALGLTTGVSVFSSRAFGAGRPDEAGEVLRHGGMIGLTAGVITGLLTTFGSPLLYLFNQEAGVVDTSLTYFTLIGWSTVPMLVALCCKQVSEAFNRVAFPMLASFGMVLLNILLNWICIFGELGVPALGIAGAGIATLLARIAYAVALLVYLWTLPDFREVVHRRWLAPLDWERTLTLLRIGWPASGQMLIEVGSFVFGAIMLGWISAEALAAHQIAISCAATTFMIPLGLSMAVTIRVGQVIGAETPERAAPISWSALWLALGIMTLSAACFLAGRSVIPFWFVEDRATALLAGQLLLAAALFQIFDGLQVVAMGALRGLADVRIPMCLIFVAYWLIALPAGAWWAFGAGHGAMGLWWGFALGLSIAAFLLCVRLRMQLRKLELRKVI